MTVFADSPASGLRLVLRSPAFVGRGRELAVLTEALARPPAVVLVEGEAGIGKSRLVQEFLALPAARRGRVLMAVCPPFLQPYTLGPVVDAVRQATTQISHLRLSDLAGVLRPLFPEWSAELPPMPEPAGDATAARHRLFRALHELFDALHVGVLVVEDAHWADDATAEFLLFLVSQRPPRISVLATYRREDLPEESLLLRLPSRLPAGSTQLRLRLEPLTVDETARLVSSMLQGEISAKFASFLHDGTDGVPLAVEESVRLMHDRADLARRGGGWARRRLDAIAIPPTVRDAVLERVRRLSVQAQTVLRAVAVLAEVSDPATLPAVSGLADAEAATGLDEALGSGLISEDARGLIAYRHALAGRAVYGAISPRQRRDMHLRAGRALQGASPLPVSRLARHFREAGESTEWCRYAEEAADQALASGDDGLAATTLLEISTAGHQTAATLLRILKKLPFAAVTSQQWFRSLESAVRAALDDGHASPSETAQHLRFQLGRLLSTMERFEEGRAEFEKALAGPPLDPSDAIRAMLILGCPQGGGTRAAAEHRRWLQSAGDLMGTVEPPASYGFAIDRASALLQLGEEDGWRALALLDQASPLLHPRQIVRRDLNAADHAIIWGRLQEARHRLAAAATLDEAQQYAHVRGLASVNLVHLDWLCGHWDGLADRAQELAEDRDLGPVSQVEARIVLALLRAATTVDAQSRSELQSSMLAARSLHERLWMEPTAALTRIHLDDGDVVSALSVTDAPMDIVAGNEIWIWATDVAPLRVAALLAAGRPDEASHLVSAFTRGMRGRNAPGPQASLLLCRAMLMEARGDLEPAAAMFEHAAAMWAAQPRPYDSLLARERRTRCLLAGGRLDDALLELSQVFQGLTTLGARRDADRIKKVLREYHINPRPAGRLGRPSYGSELSPREREVVKLVIEGLTNPQIAEALVVSVQTVASHVKSAMRKLEASSRTTLAVRAVELRDSSQRL